MGAALLALFASAAPARAEEQPSILKAYGLDWIERIKEEAWPQPKQLRPIICLLDTGVAITPDTPADNPDGPIVARLALEDGVDQGLPQGTTFAHLHGTQMASVIAAPRNGYGTVGVFPQARIVSVRVTEGAETYIAPSAIVAGVRACTRWAYGAGKTRIGAIVMAESLYDQRVADTSTWVRASEQATQLGAVLVAAVGNSQDAGIVAPVTAEGALAVAAGTDAGTLCSFAKYEPTIAILGPGCSISGGWPPGSSAATAAVGALVAAYATRLPTASGAEVATAIRTSVVASAEGVRRVDGAGIAKELFAGVIADKPAPVADSGLTVTSQSSDADPAKSASAVRLWRPRVRLSTSRGRLTVRRLDRFGSGVLAVRYSDRDGTRTRRTARAARRFAFRTSGRARGVQVWVEHSGNRPWRSLVTHARVGRS